MENVSLETWMEEASKNSSVTTEELDKLCKAYHDARLAYEKHKEDNTKLYNEAERLKGKVVEALELAGKSKYYVEGVGTFSFKDSMSVRVSATIEDKVALWKYLETTYGKEVVWDKFSINSRTLNSFYNSELEAFNERAMRGEVNGDFSLPGIQAPTAQRDLKLTKEKKK